jgi:hypothetical protein
VIEITCKNCGETIGVQSLLAAAQQPCEKCGRTLMGPMAGQSGSPSAPAWAEPGSRNHGSTLFGMVAGVFVGIGIVAAMAFLGVLIPTQVRGAVLGALIGVLLAPLLAVSSFISMFLPWTLESIIGDSMWTRIATGMRERRFGPFVLPLLVFVVLPMGLCALGGARVTAITNPMLFAASVGAIVLGAILGGVFGSLAGKKQEEHPMA